MTFHYDSYLLKFTNVSLCAAGKFFQSRQCDPRLKMIAHPWSKRMMVRQ